MLKSINNFVLIYFHFRNSTGTGLGYDIEAYYVYTDNVVGTENAED